MNRIRILRLALVACTLVALPVGLAACGGGDAGTSTGAAASPPQDVSLVLDWFPNADHAGIYTGIAQGLTTKAGAVIAPSVPSDPATTLTALAAGKSDLGITYAPELLIARAKGVPVKAVGALVVHPLNSIIARSDRGITRPRDLEGRTVGIAGVPSDRALLDTVVRNDGGDPAKVDTKVVGYTLSPALAAGKVDAIVGAYWNIEGIDLKHKGVPIRVFRLEDHGVPDHDELVIAASEDAIRERPQAIRAALAGIAAGQKAAAADPAAARAALIAANPDIAKGVLAQQIAATLPLLAPADGGPLGLEPAKWDALATWMRANGLLKGDQAGSSAVDASLLPEGSR